jgi:hypothetical protein
MAMALTSAVGKSKAPEGLMAGREAAEACLAGMWEQPELLVLFCSPHFEQDQVLLGIRGVFPQAPILGCSSAGEICQSEVDEASVVLMAIQGLQVHLQTGGNIAEDALAAGRCLGERLRAVPAQLVLMLSDGLAGDGGAVVQGVRESLGKVVPVVGGAAGDEFLFEKTYQYCHDQVLTQTTVGAALSGDFVFGIGVRHGWEPVGLPMKVTKSQGHRLYELNGAPALQFYEDTFGEHFDRRRQDPLGLVGLLYPLGMSLPSSSEYLLRGALSVEPDGALHYAADLPEGAEVCLMIGSVEGAIKAARIAAMEALSQMQGRTPQAALIFNCIARRKMFGRRAGEELDAIRDIIGLRVPVAGFYTYGEIAPVEGLKSNPTFFHNETVVILLLG